MCYATYDPGAAGNTFDGWWGMRWWRNVDGGVENEGWNVGVGEDGNVGVHGDVAGDRSGSGTLDCDWSFSWDECGVSDGKDRELVKLWALLVQ